MEEMKNNVYCDRYRSLSHMINPDIATLKKTPFIEEYSGKTIPEKYKNEADRCKLRANRFLVMFKGIDDNTYL